MASAAKFYLNMLKAFDSETDVESEASLCEEAPEGSIASTFDGEEMRQRQEVEADVDAICKQESQEEDLLLQHGDVIRAKKKPLQERMRWSDYSDSDEEPQASSPSIIPETDAEEVPQSQEITPAKGRVSTARWADLEDSEDEGVPAEAVAGSAEVTKLSDTVAVETAAPVRENFCLADTVCSDCDEDSAAEDIISAVPDIRSSVAEAAPEQRRVVQHANAPENFENQISVPKGKGKGLSKGIEEPVAPNAGNGNHVMRKNQSRAKGKGKGKGEKLQCQYTIGIEEERKFRVVSRIIGAKGANMKHINQNTGAKLRLRGRGSKFLEEDGMESKDDLMLCVSGKDAKGFNDAKELVSEVLLRIYQEYDQFCIDAGQNPPGLSIQLHDGAREGSR